MLASTKLSNEGELFGGFFLSFRTEKPSLPSVSEGERSLYVTVRFVRK